MKFCQQMLCNALLLLLLVSEIMAQTSNDFPSRNDPLHLKVEKFDRLIRSDHWNEGIIIPRVIFPPVGLDRPIIGGHADALDETGHLLVGYCYKYALTHDTADRDIADQLFAGILKLETITGIPGLVARSFYKTDQPLWHEQTMWYPMEWHWSKTMPGYRWLGDLSSDKFTSIFYSLGIYWELAADEAQKQRVAGFLDRFLGRIVDHNFKMIDLDNKMTLWGNFCPDLPHQPLNALEMLLGLKVTHHITGKERYQQAYRMLIDRYHYDDQQLDAKVIWPMEWRNRWDDNHAAKSLFMLLRLEKDPNLLLKYRMSLNRHWYVWQSYDFSFECDALYVMMYQVLTGETVLTDDRREKIKQLWGFDRHEAEVRIPTETGIKKVRALQQKSTCTLVQTYWFGRYYGLIDAKW